MKKSIQGVTVVPTLLLLPSHPYLVHEGVKNGLLLWSQTVLPTLPPFMIRPNVIVALDAIRLLTWPSKLLLTHVLKLLPAGNYILISGPLCGYPMGAKTCSEFLEDNRITGQEASRLLPTCNHPSPMFLLGYVADYIASNIPTALLLVALYLSILPLSLLSRRYYGIHGARQGIVRKPDKALSLDKTMMSFVEVMMKIGGYIMPFSTLACLLQTLPKDYGASQAVLLSVMEITTGIQSLLFHMTGPVWVLAIVTVAAFGGMSGIFRTNSVLPEDVKKAGSSIRHYILWKMLHNTVFCPILIPLLVTLSQVSGR